MARMTGFVFQDDYLERLAKLSDQELGRLVRALSIYHATGEAQELAGRESIAYDFIKADIDRIDGRYEARCQTNRNNRQRSSTIVNDRQQMATNGNESAQDKDKDKEKIFITPTTTACAREEETPFGTVTIDPLIVKIQRELNGLTDTHHQILEDYRQRLGDELVGYAVDAAVGNGVRAWNYVEAILRGYDRDNVRSIGDAKARDEKRRTAPKTGGNGKVLNAQKFGQRDYTEDEMRGTSDEDILRAIQASREGTA